MALRTLDPQLFEEKAETLYFKADILEKLGRHDEAVGTLKYVCVRVRKYRIRLPGERKTKLEFTCATLSVFF